ncbi:hypothetical protein FB446DRAFT_794599 [Lentinula raphanica]|nr:hypothetical protein FB446DRAFT_794599 [Lentinula raphanica]
MAVYLASGSQKPLMYHLAVFEKDSSSAPLPQWFGYDDPSEDTWEPPENIANFQRLLGSFWTEVGGDEGDYFPNHECILSQDWIGKGVHRWESRHQEDFQSPQLKDSQRILYGNETPD